MFTTLSTAAAANIPACGPRSYSEPALKTRVHQRPKTHSNWSPIPRIPPPIRAMGKVLSRQRPPPSSSSLPPHSHFGRRSIHYCSHEHAGKHYFERAGQACSRIVAFSWAVIVALVAIVVAANDPSITGLPNDTTIIG
ncbi:uncharacterized protein MYCGRDRAFT_97893 [Zymoseptoria tritici IPO323]|uniref:Uncharacterized protein n=1 Tax=Zymoseptoria tritici (strain CBS 115943 / IPO323) TaxID=336722 RepID=F9XRP7_ZYMTI|nr:uncharacterized protein MYCGRDRAFT_97893 [Zymoseptoria tritici IPO323]EGP82093.1 hypothetical protein MYCGRDRAFT_97893 [Zymoseptoria tritici IPO323]